MSKKIVIVGPPKAGKTTLRKIYFEGENPTGLLKFSLEPTRGQESIILNLNENIGIFDLAGQENKQWLRSDIDSIFINAQIIIVVIDVRTPIEEILAFMKKVLSIRIELTSFPLIYLLIHKIDLVDQTQIRELKNNLNKVFTDTNHLKMFFTSIKKEYFTQTFSIFINILKNCLEAEIPFKEFDFDLLESLIITLNQIGDEMFISKEELQKRLNKNEEVVKNIIKSLDTNGLIRTLDIKGKNVISLTEKGKNIFEELRNNYKYIFELENQPLFTEIVQEITIPPFVGIVITHRSGKLLLSLETFDGAIERISKMNLKKDYTTQKFEVDLFINFLCALNIFSQQFNFGDLSDIKLKGLNLKLQILKFDQFVVIIFMHANISFKPLEQKIYRYFESFIEKYNKELVSSFKMSRANVFPHINNEVQEWMKKLNKSCENMIYNFDLFNIEHAKTLYYKLDDIYNEINVEFYITLKKIRELKMNLLKAILDEDLNKIKTITQKIQDLKLKYGS